MDTSIGKALIMIAGVLLAMLVIGFVTQTFNQTSQWASSKDQEQVIEQVQKFNKEWEVYDKDLMYGVDVISCLNKALSNDKKIIKGELDDSYEIKVLVKLKNAKLEENMILYHIVDGNKGSEVDYTSSYDFNLINGKKQLKDLNFSFLKTNYPDLSSFNGDRIIGTVNKEIDLKNTEQELSISTINSETDLIKLLDVAGAVSQIIKNTDNSSKNDVNGWTKVEFRSALYYLKTRKFKCDGITYKADSGMVKKITFKEM